MKREDVQRLLNHAVESERRGYLLAQTAPHHLAALCRRWLAVEDAAEVTLDWGDFNRGLHIDDDRMTPYVWETHLTGQRVRIVPEQEKGK